MNAEIYFQPIYALNGGHMPLPSNVRTGLCAEEGLLQDRRLRRLINLIRDISFAYTPYASIQHMLELGAGGCTPKHALLHTILKRHGISSRLVWVSLEYESGAYPYPDGMHLAEPGELYGHTSLQIQTNVGWQFLDITFDRFLRGVFFVNHDLLLSNEPVPFGKVVNLSVASDTFDRDSRIKALGLPLVTDSHLVKEKRMRMKLVNKWLIEIRRAQFSIICEEYRELKESLVEISSNGHADGAANCPSGDRIKIMPPLAQPPGATKMRRAPFPPDAFPPVEANRGRMASSILEHASALPDLAI